MKLTKYMLWLLAISICVGLTACGSDDDDDNLESKVSVIGVWRHDFGDGYQLLTLEKNGKYSLVEFDFESGNWSETGSYTVDDNIMTRILSDGDVEVYTILTLTHKKMVTRYEGEYLGQYGDSYGDKDYEDWTRVED